MDKLLYTVTYPKNPNERSNALILRFSTTPHRLAIQKKAEEETKAAKHPGDSVVWPFHRA